MQFASLAIRLVVLCALLVLAVIDVRARRLPTGIVVAIGALFFVDALINKMSLDQIISHLMIACVVFAVCAALFAAKMLGGGDAKLAAVIFLWSGLGLSLSALTLISVIGTVVSLVNLVTRNMNADQKSSPMRALAMFSGARGVPYGVALALGGGLVIVLPAALPLLLPLFSTH
ncbi:Type IV prepilin peptidase TadV/CpaA [Candidatus Burkholderia verschuerenii]|uniref:Type IV prepilin peptidase TadV/CpaA n=1 Tax=Candidatus Burkholderia verschuerenii TaxID=242163 RepID=A0A0L0MD36_9BURK|nr:prepilin peptidase [Candidatus Burkholderia verschuerenii]KND59894.1 Type IV prepilin peptidase TadV/CpaA [Candidatus Burkholderia verschuerenii]